MVKVFINNYVMRKLIVFLISTMFCFLCRGQGINYQTSTYDEQKLSNDIKPHQKALTILDENKVFYFAHNHLLNSIASKHKEYFKLNPDYELLFLSRGDIFLNKADDYAFVVYDKKYLRISIIVYNEITNKYHELYRDIKIDNGLEYTDCNYHSFGTLDYQIANNLIYQTDYLIKKPERISEITFCKIAIISNDEDFILENGCFSKKVSKTNFVSSLCISTSSVYNNWECMKFDKSKNLFIIYFGQAFTD